MGGYCYPTRVLEREVKLTTNKQTNKPMKTLLFSLLTLTDAVLLRFWDVGTSEKYIIAGLAYTAMIGAVVASRKEGGAL